MSLLADGRSVRGRQLPRISHVPAHDSTAAGDDAIECAGIAGLQLDEWQQHAVRFGLAERDSQWAAREVGVCAPRQNGKGGIIETLELYWLFVLDEPLIVHSAHLFDTSIEAMRRLTDLIDGVDEFRRRVKTIRTANGQEVIELLSGARIRFKTRTRGGGRGLSAPKFIADEAMYLPEEVMGAVMPIMSAQKEAQAWFLGSAVDQVVHDHGVTFSRIRERGLSEDGDLAYFEWSVDAENPDQLSDYDANNRELWASANPALGVRISERAIESEMATLARRTFAVERLGVGDWPRTDGLADTAIDPRAWDDLTDRNSEFVGDVVFAIDVAPDRAHACISAAGKRADGLFHVERVSHGRGTGWVAQRAGELQANHKPKAFVCDQVGPAMSLLPDLERAGVTMETLTSQDHAQACAFLYDAVEQKTLRHLGTDELRSAVRGAAKRPLGDAWAWSRKNSSVDITPLVSATLALWRACGTDEKPLIAWSFV